MNAPTPTEVASEAIQAALKEAVPIKSDPGTSGMSLAATQVETLVTNMTATVTHELTLLRDEVDDTIRNYEAHSKAILELVSRHRETGDSARAVKNISADAMRQLQDRLREEGAAITKLVNGNNGEPRRDVSEVF